MKKIKTIYWIIVLSVITGIFIQIMPASDLNQGKLIMDNKNFETAVFAGGCFWCVEAAFEGHKGVIDVVSGYTGGHVSDPGYEQVTSGTTGHFEAVKINFNPDIITYKELLKIFFQQIDPTDFSGSFVDRGSQYSSAIFYQNDTQKKEALKTIEKINQSKLFDIPVATQVLKFKTFYDAEVYHQDYHKKNPIRYKYYRTGSGRDRFIEKAWKNKEHIFDSEKSSADKLTPLQYKVTRQNGTEPPFDNEYWDNEEEGIYVDVVSGEPLFSSTDKYVSGTGWPSFTKPLEENNVVTLKDYKLFIPRTEVRSNVGDSHLGHVFDDGPEPNGLRWCMNSAALKFIPKNELTEKGYEEYSYLFD